MNTAYNSSTSSLGIKASSNDISVSLLLSLSEYTMVDSSLWFFLKSKRSFAELLIGDVGLHTISMVKVWEGGYMAT